MDAKQLQAIEERWGKATPVARGVTEQGQGGILWTLFSKNENRVASVAKHEDAIFFQQSYFDIRILLAEVRRLQGENISMRNCRNCKHKRPRECGWGCADCEKPCPCASCYESKQKWEAADNG